MRGASDAKAVVICSSRSSVSFGEIAAQAKTPLWLSIYADEAAGAERKLQEAKAAGCQALCITVGAGSGARTATPSRVNWTAIEHLRKLAGMPVVVKGVTTDADALAAIDRGVQGIVVSTHGMAAAAGAAPIEVLASIADRVRGKTALLVDGSFRRGADILKALILGAQAVIVARPVMWGLAAYGADGVQRRDRDAAKRSRAPNGRHRGAESVNSSRVTWFAFTSASASPRHKRLARMKNLNADYADETSLTADSRRLCTSRMQRDSMTEGSREPAARGPLA